MEELFKRIEVDVYKMGLYINLIVDTNMSEVLEVLATSND
jgi:hypothetical protein